jgi:hypothetical protein
LQKSFSASNIDFPARKMPFPVGCKEKGIQKGQAFDSAILLRRPFDLARSLDDFQRAAKQRSELSPRRGSVLSIKTWVTASYHDIGDTFPD